LHEARSLQKRIAELEGTLASTELDPNVIRAGLQKKIQGVYDLQQRNERGRVPGETQADVTTDPTAEDKDLNEKCNVIYRRYLLQDAAQVTCFIDHSICKDCNTATLFETTTSLSVCPRCGISKPVVYCETTDLIEYKGRRRKNTYNRVPLYSRFVRQFSMEFDPMSFPNIRSLLMKHIRNKHICSLKLAKPTPVSNFLRLENLGKLIPYAVRICKFLNGEKIPVMDEPLLERLSERFAILTAVLKDMDVKEKKKLMSFEYITKQFLLMEGRRDLAECFLKHKTRKIVQEADLRIFLCCEHINRQIASYEEKHCSNEASAKKVSIGQHDSYHGSAVRTLDWGAVPKLWYENGFQGKVKKQFCTQENDYFCIFSQELKKNCLKEVGKSVYTVLKKYNWVTTQSF